LTLLAELVATSDAVAATAKRSAKIAALAELLRSLEPDEVEAATAFLTGEPRQGKIGVGWAAISKLQPEAAPTPTLTVADLDAAITALQETTGAGSAALRAALMSELLGRATPPEANFVGRLLVGELRQGALEGVMTEAIARASTAPAAAVRRAVMLAGDLPYVARLALADGAAALAEVGLKVLQPVQPMLAATAASVEDAVAACGESSVEWKLDGVRIQVHRRGDAVRIFTRNLNDVTDRLPAVVHLVGNLPCDDLILDGEAIGADAGVQPEMFQEVMSRFGRHDGGGGRLAALFFDCLHVDGDDLIDRPLGERIAVLEEVAGPLRIPGTITADPAAAAGVLDAALAAGHEGVMVKAISSLYAAGRRGKAWRKVKPVETVDLVVLAAEWGHGRRRGWLSNLHLGARDPDGGFVMVGKTFKGLTDELLTWQTEQFLARETGRRGITVDVRPELVVEVALDGVQRSTRYAGGVALRFARVKRYRLDKAATEAVTIGAVRALLPGGRGG
jgi:DNA ligase-1